MQNDAIAREVILEATIALIEKHGDINKIKIRDIAEKADVGIGLINYHFQTKDNLINACVQKMIGRVIEKFEPMYKALELKPKDKLKFLAKSTASFIAANPGLSRISILNDMMAGSLEDNSSQTFKAYYPVFRELGPEKSEEEINLQLHTFIASVQSAFLRHEVIRKRFGYDFFISEQRNAFVDHLVDSLFHDE